MGINKIMILKDFLKRNTFSNALFFVISKTESRMPYVAKKSNMETITKGKAGRIIELCRETFTFL